MNVMIERSQANVGCLQDSFIEINNNATSRITATDGADSAGRPVKFEGFYKTNDMKTT